MLKMNPHMPQFGQGLKEGIYATLSIHYPACACAARGYVIGRGVYILDVRTRRMPHARATNCWLKKVQIY